MPGRRWLVWTFSREYCLACPQEVCIFEFHQGRSVADGGDIPPPESNLSSSLEPRLWLSAPSRDTNGFVSECAKCRYYRPTNTRVNPMCVAGGIPGKRPPPVRLALMPTVLPLTWFVSPPT